MRVEFTVGVAPWDMVRKTVVADENRPELQVMWAPIVEKFRFIIEDVARVSDIQADAPIHLDFRDEMGEPWAPCEKPTVTFAPNTYAREREGMFEVVRPELILRAIDLRRGAWRKSVGAAPGSHPETALRQIIAYGTTRFKPCRQ